MQINGSKGVWTSLIFLAASTLGLAPAAQASDWVRIVHAGQFAEQSAQAKFMKVHGGHRHGARRHGPRFVTERICHRHRRGGRRHCHTFVRKVYPDRFSQHHHGFGGRRFDNHARGFGHGHRPHPRRHRGFNLILNL